MLFEYKQIVKINSIVSNNGIAIFFSSVEGTTKSAWNSITGKEESKELVLDQNRTRWRLASMKNLHISQLESDKYVRIPSLPSILSFHQ